MLLIRAKAVAVCMFGLVYGVEGAAIHWNPGSGEWNVPGNWSPGQVPTAIDDVFIDNGTTGTASSVNVNVDADANTITLDSGDTLFISNAATLTTNAIHGQGQNGTDGALFTSNPGTSGTPGATFATFNNSSLSTPTLNLYGGNGGSGGGNLTGGGGAAGHGGDGGVFAAVSFTTIDNIGLDLAGGNGGNGGASGSGSGRDGGQAGDGGSLNIAAPATIVFNASTIDLSGGNGGNGGVATGILDNGGNGQNGGNGGVITVDGSLTFNNSTLVFNPGIGGIGGSSSTGSPGSNGSSGAPGGITLNSGSLTLVNTPVPTASLIFNGGALTLDNTDYNAATTTLNLPGVTTIKNTASLTGITNLQLSADTAIDNTTLNVPGQINNDTNDVHLQILNGATVTSNDYLTGGDLTIDGTGTVYTTGITNSPGDNTRDITVSNGATFNTTAPAIFFGESNTITVQDPSSTWDHTGAFTLQQSDLTIANGAQANSDSATLGFDGDVVVQDPGSHWFPGSLNFLNTASVTVSNGATMQTSGTTTIDGEASSLTVGDPDSVWASFGAATVDGEASLRALNQGLVDIIGPLQIERGGFFQIATNATVRAQTIKLGTDNEDPDDPITTLNSWSNGTLHLSHPTQPVHIGGAENALNTFPGKLTLAANRTFIVDSATTPIDLPGILTLNGGTLITHTLDLPSGDALDFAAGTLQITHPDPTPIGPDLAAPTNAMPPHTILTTGAHLITDAGTLLTPTGILDLQGGTLTTPTLTREAGSVLHFNHGTLHLTGPGGASIGGTQTDPNNLPTVTTLGPDASLIIDNAGSVQPDATLVIAGGNYTAPTLTVHNNANVAVVDGMFNPGALFSAGTIELSPGTTTNITSGTTILTASGTLNANGTLNAQTADNEGTINTFAGDLSFGGSVTNDVVGEINAVNATFTFPGDGVPNDDGLVNEGTLNLINTTINGDVRSPTGSLINVAGAVTFNGFFSGAATFPGAGTVIFNGGFSPGDSPATIDFHADLSLGKTNNLILELGADDHDQLNITNQLHAAGDFSIKLLDGYTPTTGDSFQLLNFESTTGTFSAINLPTGYQFDTTQLLTTGTLTVIPEPTTLSLLTLTLLAINPRKRRPGGMDLRGSGSRSMSDLANNQSTKTPIQRPTRLRRSSTAQPVPLTLILSLTITLALTIALTTHAAPVAWTGGPGDWDNPAMWSPAPPTPADDAFIDNGLTATASPVLLDTHAQVNSLTIDPDDALNITPGPGIAASLTTPTITGTGTNGANATTPGASGTPGSNAATLTLTGDALLDAQSLNFTGGLGGNGAAATGSGGHGATGGNGLTLNVPADSELNLHDGTVNLSGGNGGNGADGFTSGLSIGIGGNGGNGGHAGSINITGGHAALTNATAILSPGTGGSQGIGSFISGIPGFPGLPGNVNLSSGSLTLTNTTLPAASLIMSGGELTLDNNTYDPGATTFALPVTTTLKNNVAFTGVTLLEIAEHTTMDNSTMHIPGQLRLTTAASTLDIVNGSTVSSDSLGFDANAMLALHGAGTQLNTGSIVYVDITAEPTIEVSGGAALNTTGISLLRNGQITIQGPSTTWTDTGCVVIEPIGTGSNTLTIENGATVNTASFRLLSNSQAILTGEDTTWDVGYLFTRTQSDNSLQINGGTLRIGAAQIHYTHLDWIAGTVHITGPDPVEIEKSDFDTFNTFPNPVEILPNQTFISDVGMTVSSVPGSTLTLSGGTLVTNYLKQDAAERIVLNWGTLHKTGPDPLLIGSDPTLLNALETVTDLPTGLHIIADDGVEISGDGQLNLLGGTLTTTTITRASGSPIGLGFNTGTLHLTSPAGATIGGTQTDPNALPPTFTLGTDAHLVLDAAAAIEPDGFLILTGGTYNAPSTDVQTAGQIAVLDGTFNTGSLTNAGNIQTSPGTTTNITEGPLTITPGATLTANGTLNAQSATNDASLNTFAGNLTFAGNVTNNPAAEINATNATLTFPANDLPDEVGLTNHGTLNLINTTINGDVRSPAGSLINVAGAVTFNGLFSGAATFPGAGTVIFNGGFSPGDSPAAITFHNDLTLGFENNLTLELGETDHDQLNITHTLNAAGTLTIELLDDYHPIPGDSFQLLTFTTTTGYFSQINLPDAYQFDTTQLLTTGTLTVIPEPTTLSLLSTILLLTPIFPRKPHQIRPRVL